MSQMKEHKKNFYVAVKKIWLKIDGVKWSEAKQNKQFIKRGWLNKFRLAERENNL